MHILDNHVHTHFSSDGKDHMETVIKEAIKNGVSHLTFTDHLEYNTDHFSLDLDGYIKQIDEYKEKYKKDINLLTGVEVGYKSYIRDKIENIIKSYPFDFVLCSTHTVGDKDISRLKYFDGLTKKEAYDNYYKSIIETNKQFSNYDTYGHLDYVIRYGNYEDKKIAYNDHKEVLDETLKTIINLGKGIELNTSGYRYNLDSPHPNIDILKRYKELGGEIITVGSDSHRAIDVCRDFDKAYAILDYLGFEYVCLFEERKPKFIKFNSEIIYSA